MAKRALLAGARLLLNSDAHDLPDLLTGRLAHSIASGAGLEDKEATVVLEKNPLALLDHLNSA